jgi:hypothetical protein
MFERFKKSRGTDAGASSVATRERETRADAPMDGATTRDAEMSTANERVDTGRFERVSPGERDRGVEAGGGDADLAADRSFEREEMARGTTGDGDTALDRDHAREDLGRDDMDRRDMDRDGIDDRDEHHRHHVGPGAAAAAGAVGGAAAMHHHDRERDRELADDRAMDDDRAMPRDRTMADDRAMARDRTMTDDRAMADDHTMADERAMDDRTMADDRALADDRGMAAGGTVAGDRAVTRDHDLDRDGVDDRVERRQPVLAPAALDTMRARQRDRFGGIQWGSDFFGWLCAIGLASILTAVLVGAGVALGLSTDDAGNSDTAQQIGLGGGIALLVVLAIAWFCGGYVAGRMARFDGARQGVGVWLWTLLAAIIVAGLAAIGGSEYDIFQRLNLPRIAVGDTTLTAGGAIAGAAAIVVTLLAAIIGGKVGERYHTRVDRLATDEYVVER